MLRSLLFVVAGVLLGLVIHLVIILTLPTIAAKDVFTRVGPTMAVNKVSVLPPVVAGATNPLRLDPDLAYAACRMNLRDGPGEITGTLPLAFWSIAVYDPSGTVIYSTTSRGRVGQTLDVGIFNAAQTSLLAQQKIDVSNGLLIVESRSDDILVVVRLEPPQPVMRARYADQLGKLTCRRLKT